MDPCQNLTDRSFTILRKRNFIPLTFQEFRAQYATTFNVMNPPERAKLMKLPIVKVSYSQKHKKQTMKVLIEKDYLCDKKHSYADIHECNKLHCLKSSDRCHLYDKHQTCNNPKCTKLHIPSNALRSRIIQVFKKSSRSCMPFSKFIVLHRTTYPYLREHHPTNDILTTNEFWDIVRIENTEKTKQIRLVRRRPVGDKYCGIERPPTLSENIDAPHPALKIASFDTKWVDTANLLHDMTNLFATKRIKDIFIPGHIRMAFVTFNKRAQTAVKKFNNTWFCGRKVSVALTQLNNTDCKDEEKVPSSSSRILIKPLNNVIAEQRIREWLDGIGGIVSIETCFVQCRKGSDIAYVHFKSMRVIHDILNKHKKNNCVVTFRGKHMKLMLCDDGYTDCSTYFSLKTKEDAANDEQKQMTPLKLQKAKSFSHCQQKTLHKKNDSMQLLVMRLKSLIESTIQTQKDLQTKLEVLRIIDNGFTLTHDEETHKKIDIDAAFGDESYTIFALRESLKNIRTDKNQIQVYKQALTAFETSQSRAINKNQRELKPIGDKEIRLAKALQSVKSEIELLDKQLALKRNECEVIKSDLEITRIKAKSLRKTINEMKHKIEPIRACVTAFDDKHRSHHHRHSSHRRASSRDRRSVDTIRADQIPNDEQIDAIEESLATQEKKMKHWLKWKEWNLSDATQWIGSLANGRLKPHLSSFNALSKISQGSILNAITDPTLQIIGIDQPQDRKMIIHNIAMLKSRTAMMKKCAKTFANPHKTKKRIKRRGSISESSSNNKLKQQQTKSEYGLDDID
eukprot:208775_1